MSGYRRSATLTYMFPCQDGNRLGTVQISNAEQVVLRTR